MEAEAFFELAYRVTGGGGIADAIDDRSDGVSDAAAGAATCVLAEALRRPS